MKSLKARLLVISCLLVGLCSPAWASTLNYDQPTTGNIGSVAQSNSYNLMANAGDVLNFTVVTTKSTSGTLGPCILLYDPTNNLVDSAGGSYSPVVEMNVYQVLLSGTYTVLVEDCAGTATGDYTIFVQKTNAPVGAVPLPYDQPTTGAIGSVAQSNAYTLTVNANDVLNFTVVTTKSTSSTLGPCILLYNSTGMPVLDSAGGSYSQVVEMNGYKIPASGTYNVLIEDCAGTATGDYTIFVQKTNAPVGAVPLLYDQPTTGAIGSVAQSNAYTLTANANDVLNFTVVTTKSTSSTLGPCILLYNSTGAPVLDSAGGSYSPVVEMNGYQVLLSGTYTVLVEDCAGTATGDYTIFVQKTNAPVGAVPLPYDQPTTGNIGSVAQSNAYTLTANANDVLNFTVVTTKSTSSTLGPCILLYNSTGAPVLDSAGGSYSQVVEMNGYQVPASGTYNVLIEDCAGTATGNYTIFVQKTNAPVGAVPIVYDQVQTGTIGSVAQSNAYTLIGTINDVLNFTVVTTKSTSSTLGPCILLYNSTGTPTPLDSAGGSYSQVVEMNGYKIPASGTYNVLIEDCAGTATGNYTLSTTCIGTCKLPVPMVTSISPSSALAGDPAFTLTVNGSGFASVEAQSVVQWAGTNLSTTFVNTGQLTALVPATDLAHIGMYPVTVYTPGPGGGTSTSQIFTVNKGTPIIYWPTPAAITYGTALGSTQLDAVFTNQAGATVPGQPVYTPGTGTVLGAGSPPLSVTFTPTDTTDYNMVTGTTTITVNKAVLTVTANNVSVPYDQPIPKLGYTPTGFVNSETSSVLTGEPSETTTAIQGLAPATYPIMISQGALAATNYTFKFVNGTLTITQLSQTITFPALPNVTYGVSPITLTAIASSGLPVSYTVQGPASISGSALTITGAGSVTVTASQTGNKDYAPAPSVPQTFNVFKALVTVTANNESVAFDQPIPAPTYTVTGFVNGDTQQKALSGEPLETTTATQGSAPGTYPITITQGTLAAANYTFTFVNGTLTILPTALQFVPIMPCRIADTRWPTGLFGGPELSAGSTRDFDIPQSGCNIPSTAVAYSLNVTVVPNGALGYLTLWGAGQIQPYVSTMNSDGRIKAVAAITSAGNGGVDVFVTDATHVILDINGYFVPEGTASSTLAFYPLTPCRVVDTEWPTGPLGGPYLSGGSQGRAFPVQSSNCGIPPTAQAYSLNVTAVPHKTLNYLTIWATGQSQPPTSTLNSSTGTVVANAALVAAGTTGDVSVYVSDDADVILDINGYFAPPETGGLSLYTVAPCRVIDTRSGSGAFDGTLNPPVNIEGSTCAPPSTALAYVLNATVVPSGPLDYLTLWPDGEMQAYVSTLNALDGAITSNMAIVPTNNGKIDAYASNPTNLILDLSSYFAP